MEMPNPPGALRSGVSPGSHIGGYRYFPPSARKPLQCRREKRMEKLVPASEFLAAQFFETAALSLSRLVDTGWEGAAAYENDE